MYMKKKPETVRNVDETFRFELFMSSPSVEGLTNFVLATLKTENLNSTNLHNLKDPMIIFDVVMISKCDYSKSEVIND